MIRYSLIVEAAALTAAAVVLAAAAARWAAGSVAAAAAGAFATLIAWRALANALSLNADFIAYVSVGDCGCLVAGALVPAIVGFRPSAPRRAHLLPSAAGGIAGFLINVVIL
ncbi:MAG: hypothetical protein E6I76_08980 [Chloroflexi bacterium]|nr:MAG: hypothetical protein E6I76_08980 [Chloroflexota bacterium]